MSIIDCDGYLPDYDLDCICPDESVLTCMCCGTSSHSLVDDA